MKDLAALLQEEQDITTHYRITSLVRRRPYVNLYLALDNQPSARGRMVTMRDIDFTSLEDEQARMSAIELVQEEYDLLRRCQPPYIMPAIELRYAGGHLFTVAGFAPPTRPGEVVANKEAGETKENWPRLTTLQDYLQSGQGLPSEQRTLQIMGNLCSAVNWLHSHQVVIGDLDPYTVILNGETVDAQPGLMISWLLPRMRSMLPPPKQAAPLLSYFIAPEALRGNADARSDVYSLGAIFYLLLTGIPPEESTLRTRNRLRTPQEVHARVGMHVSESVMQALVLEPVERFQSVAAFSEALRNPRYRRPVSRRESETPDELNSDVETVRIVPLSHKDVARWRAGRPAETPLVGGVRGGTIPARPVMPRPSLPPGEVAAVETNGELPRDSQLSQPAGTATPPATGSEQRASADIEEAREERRRAEVLDVDQPPIEPAVPARSWMKRVTGMLPAIRPGASSSKHVSRLASPAQKAGNGMLTTSRNTNSWFEQLKHAVLGKQQHAISAAAIIETPLRVLPDQLYTIRLHVMGRDEAAPLNHANRGVGDGLSALVHGDVALIEVRSVLHQSYAYVVQLATVTIPAEGYVAEVTIPMQPLSSSPTGRRDRLHISFLNEQRHPLYEKPFVLEIFVSNHVKRGSEGHHVLTIPV
ncbi:MAG: hypothetical protein NVS3B14_13940 [Ktedonobacteraceae bacterium]